MLIVFILFVCFLLALGYFFTGSPVGFTVKTLVGLGALIFAALVVVIIWTISSPSRTNNPVSSNAPANYQSSGQTTPTSQTTVVPSIKTLPTLVGRCDSTTVSQIGTRLTDGTTNNPVPGTGSAIWYADGGYQVSYDTIQGVTDSQVGDQINLCLISIPTNCPVGDNRGRVYQATNLRTGERWTAQDAEHSCGGA